MTQLNAYLSFDGNCAEAMRFYEKTLHGKLEALLTFAQTPPGTRRLPRMRTRLCTHLLIDGQGLMAADAPSGMTYQPMKGCALALSYETADEAKRVFDAAEGGKITMPFNPSFWADGFGMVDDRFGTH